MPSFCLQTWVSSADSFDAFSFYSVLLYSELAPQHKMVIMMMMKKRGHCSAGKAALTGETTMHEGEARADYDCATAVFSFAFSFVDYVFSWTWTFLLMFDSSWYFNSNGCFAASTEQSMGIDVREAEMMAPSSDDVEALDRVFDRLCVIMHSRK